MLRNLFYVDRMCNTHENANLHKGPEGSQTMNRKLLASWVGVLACLVCSIYYDILLLIVYVHHHVTDVYVKDRVARMYISVVLIMVIGTALGIRLFCPCV